MDKGGIVSTGIQVVFGCMDTVCIGSKGIQVVLGVKTVYCFLGRLDLAKLSPGQCGSPQLVFFVH